MQIECENSDFICENNFDLYVIHTAAPVSVKNYDMRNNQIGKLLSDFLKHHES